MTRTHLTTLLTILFAMTTFTTTATSATTGGGSGPSIPGGSSGGGGGGPVIEMGNLNTEISQSINLGNLRANAHMSYEPERICRDKWGNIDHIHAPQTNGNVYGLFEQGAFNKGFVPTETRATMYLDEEEEEIRFELTFRTNIVDEPTNWNDMPRSYTYVDLLGLEFNMGTEVQHYEDWFYDPNTQTGHSIPTNHVEMTGNFWMEHVTPKRINLNLEEENWSNQPFLELEARFYVSTEDLPVSIDTLREAFADGPITIPEPATLTLLALGGIVFAHRRRRRHS